MEAYDKVENYRSRFEELFKLADVSISDSDPARTRDIWLIACEIIGSIYLDFGDCIVYADAILAQADEFLTLDSYFRKTVCYINNPGASPAAQKDLFWRAHDRVKSSVANLIGSDIGNVILPIGQET